MFLPTPAAPAAAARAPRRGARVRGGRLLLHGLPLLIYTAAALILTWPLVAHFGSHVPGDGIDDPSLAWNLWWVGERLVNQRNFDLFHVGWLFHPVAINLAYYTLTPLHGLLSLPLQGAFGLIAANNLILLSTFVLGGYGSYLLVWSLLAPLQLRSDGESRPHAFAAAMAAALPAGFLYAFAAPRLFYVALGQFNIAGSQWIPFCAFFAVRLMQARTPAVALRAGALAGLFLVLQAWTELTFASFLLLFMGGAAVIGFPAAVRRRRWQGFAGGFAVAGALFVIGIAPILAAMLPDMRAEGDFFASGGGFADIYSADLAGYLLPTRLHPLAGELAAALPFPNDKGQQIWLGYTALLLALPGVVWLWRRTRTQALFWSLSALGFWLLSLGPSLRWMGRDLAIPGPFTLVSRLPFFNGNRYPSRYSVMLLLCIGVLAAAGVVAIVGALQRRGVRRAPLWVGGVVGALLLLEHVAIPLPMSDLRVPAVYQRLAAEPDDLAVLELPTGWRNGARVLGYSDLLIMRQQWWQSAHGKRRLGGNTSRNPPHKMQYFSEHPLLSDLIALMNAAREHLQPVIASELDAMIARHAPIAAQELADLGVGYVTVHVEHADPALLRFIDEALPLELLEEWQGLDPDGKPATIRLYRARNAAELDANDAQRVADLTDPADAGFLAEGWSPLPGGSLRYANRPASHLLLPLPNNGGRVHLAVSEAPNRILLNGVPTAALWDGEELTINLRYGAAAEPVDRLTIEWAGGRRVTALARSPSAIGATGERLPAGATLAVRSAGEEVGDFAELWVNGVDVAAELPQRGYLLAALQPSGALLEAAAFDTHADAGASARMATWIAQWPQGTIVTGAVADEANRLLGADAVAALASLGVATDLRDHFRWSHAFVGVVGAPPATAAEEAGLTRPASAWVGVPVTGARVYGAVSEISWQGAGQVAGHSPIAALPR